MSFLGDGTLFARALGFLQPQAPGSLEHAEARAANLRGCANRSCGSRVSPAGSWDRARTPTFDGRSACSRECLQVLVATALQLAALHREVAREPYVNRVPLGLLMLSRQWITREQLAVSLALQKASGAGRLGEWLLREKATNEDTLARALATQWAIPVLPPLPECPGAVASLLPQLFIDMFSVVPYKLTAAGVLYLAVDDQVDPCLMAAIEIMTGFKAEAGIMKPRAFERFRKSASERAASHTRHYASTSMTALESSMTELVAAAGPSHSRLVRIGEYFWLRTDAVALSDAGVSRTHQDHLFTLHEA